MCKSMRQPKDLEVVSVIDVVDNEVTNTIMDNHMDDPLVGTMWKYVSEVIKEKYEVVNLMMSLGLMIESLVRKHFSNQ